MTGPARLYHAVVPEDWEEARRLGEYRWSTRGLTFDDVGFVHLSHEHQYPGVLERFYADRPDSLVLVVDPERLEAEVRVEASADAGGERFPHLYGPLPLDAVVAVIGPGTAT